MDLTILIVPLVIFIFIAAFVLVRTSLFLRSEEPVEPIELPEVDADLIGGNLAVAVRCETISTDRGELPNPGAFRELRRALETLYPRVHSTLQREIISDHSLLYIWKGSDLEQPPVLFCAHLDVVPVDADTLDQWQHPPFAGEVADGYVWGRGALDDKSQVISLLESVEYLLKSGFSPERSIFLAFGQDEETGGVNGAAKIAQYLEERGERFELVLDEGGAITVGALAGVEDPVALVGITEKGHLCLRLSVTTQGGHSSTPPPSSAIGILARAITAIEDSPQRANLLSIQRTYRALGAAASPWMQMLFANRWLFGGLLRRRIQSNPKGNASIRTTAAVTMIKGGFKENVLPYKAEALVNYRLFPGDTIAAVCEHARKVIDDQNVQIEAVEGSAWEAAPVTPTDGSAYVSLSRAIRQVFPGVEVAPYLVLGATDSRHYQRLSDQVLRFSPLFLPEEELKSVHGVNERISVDALGRMTQFYIHLMREWCSSVV